MKNLYVLSSKRKYQDEEYSGVDAIFYNPKTAEDVMAREYYELSDEKKNDESFDKENYSENITHDAAEIKDCDDSFSWQIQCLPVQGGLNLSAKELAEEVVDCVNAFRFDDVEFAKTIAMNHRTLQQSVMRLFITTIRALSESGCDARNEATVELAKQIVKLADKTNLPLI